MLLCVKQNEKTDAMDGRTDGRPKRRRQKAIGVKFSQSLYVPVLACIVCVSALYIK